MTDAPPEPEPLIEVPAKRRPPIAIQMLIVVVAIAVAVGAWFAVHGALTSLNTATKPGAVSVSGPANMASGGALLTGANGSIQTTRTAPVTAGHLVPTDTSTLPGATHIVEYVDLQCPYCLNFEITNLSNVAGLVAEGKATLELHPISILDRSSEGTRYSSRAANAMACVASYSPDEFLNALAVLYEYQPQEGTSGLTNAQILKYLSKADVSTPSVTKCVNTEQYRSWVSATTAAVEQGNFAGVSSTPVAFAGTPTVFVNGVQYDGSITDAKAFTAFINAQSAG